MRALVIQGLAVTVAIAALATAARPGAAAEMLGMVSEPAANNLVFCGLAIAFLSLSFVAVGQLTRLVTLGRRWRSAAALAQSSKGTIVVEFALNLPIILLVVGMIMQIALLANASLVVRYAAFTAARSAIVRFEYPDLMSVTDQLTLEPEKVALAAHLVVASLSPKAAGGGGSEAAQAIYEIHRAQGGPWGSRSFVRRMRYAEAACRVVTEDRTPRLIPAPEDVIPPPLQALGFDFDIPLGIALPTAVAPREIIVTVEYDFLLVVPGLSFVPGLTHDAPAGVPGRVFTIRQSVRLQSIGARQSSPASLLPLEGNSPIL